MQKYSPGVDTNNPTRVGHPLAPIPWKTGGALTEEEVTKHFLLAAKCSRRLRGTADVIFARGRLSLPAPVLSYMRERIKAKRLPGTGVGATVQRTLELYPLSPQ